MQGGVLVFGRDQYVAGLSWRHEGRKKPSNARLKEVATTEGRWGMVRRVPDGDYQAGFCEPVEGIVKPSKVKSLADAVADVRVGPWRGWFDLGDGRHWYIAVAPNYEVLPGGDRLCNAGELAALREEQASFYDNWKEVHGTMPDLAELVAAGGNRSSLRNFNPSLGNRFNVGGFKKPSMAAGLGGLAAFVVVSAAVGAVVYERHAKAAAAAKADRDRRLAELGKLLNAKSVPPPPPPPWTMSPRPGAVFEGCQAAWHEQALAIKGFVLERWTCKVASAGVDVEERWTRDGGLALSAPGQLDPNGEGSTSTRSLAIDWTLPAQASSAPGGAVASLLTPDMAQRSAWDLVQRYGSSAGLVLSAPKPIGKPAGSDEAPPPWIDISTTWTLPFAPWLGFGPAFDHLSGLRVSSITHDFKAGTWSVVADLYAGTGVAAGSKIQ